MAYGLYDQRLLSGESAQDKAGVIPGQIVKSARELAVYVEFGALTSAGAVVVEAAALEGYTGTWAVLATVNWAAASRVHEVAVSGVHKAIRARISVAIVGGIVNVDAVAN